MAPLMLLEWSRKMTLKSPQLVATFLLCPSEEKWGAELNADDRTVNRRVPPPVIFIENRRITGGAPPVIGAAKIRAEPRPVAPAFSACRPADLAVDRICSSRATISQA